MDDSDHIGNSIGPDTEEGLAGPLVALTEVNDDNSNSMNGAKKLYVTDMVSRQMHILSQDAPLSKCSDCLRRAKPDKAALGPDLAFAD